jgi:hypothetical protein
MRFHLSRLGMAIVLTLWGVVAQAGMELVMVEQPGCIYCERWDQDVANEYPLTDEGKAAPLRRIQLRAPVPEGLRLDRPAAFTPTFILIRDGAEVDRIEGYPGEDFFWGLLARMIADAGPAG